MAENNLAVDCIAYLSLMVLCQVCSRLVLVISLALRYVIKSSSVHAQRSTERQWQVGEPG